MMRKLFVALAFFATAIGAVAGISLAHAQTPPRANVSEADKTFYFAVLRTHATTAADNTTVRWTRDNRSGTVEFAPSSATQRAEETCRNYFLREMSPTAKPPVSGIICTSDSRRLGYPGGNPEVAEGAFNYELRRIENPPAAGPGGEPTTAGTGTGGTRGIVVARPRSPEPASPAPSTPGATQVNIKPVLVQINRQTRRENQNGGHAVVLLRDTTASRGRNQATCEALLRHFDDAPISEVRVGVRREADGSISALRPIYWPVDERVTVVGDRCAQRLQRYDYARAITIRDKLRLAGEGPYLVVTRSDERQAAVIDLSRLSAAEIDKAAVYFRDGFSQRGNVWNPQDFTRQRQEQSLIASFGADFPRVLLAAVGFYSSAATNAGAAASSCLGDLSDTRRC